MDQRLAVMPEVAAFKAKAHKPISDPAREKQVIEQSVAEAEALHLDGVAAREFFAEQITMAKAVEEAALAGWAAHPDQAPPARDLLKEIRPELDRIDRQLLPAVYLASTALNASLPSQLQSRLRRLLRQPGATDEQLAALAAALGKFRITAAPDWVLLKKVGVLRVGTTGDYAPFSSDRGGSLRGLDIDLTQQLAGSWGVSVEYVHTSWPTLMADLAQHRFDLAASGVSITPERQEHAAFSTPYYVDGKMPIARRENAARFSSLEQIDQPGVRVIENAGGTNEKFAREHLHHATILIHSDNRTIFDELIAGRADVMFTDGVEVRLQTRRHPELQATRREPLTRSGKAFLFPPSSDLIPRCNAWLKPQIADGQIRQLVDRGLYD